MASLAKIWRAEIHPLRKTRAGDQIEVQIWARRDVTPVRLQGTVVSRLKLMGKQAMRVQVGGCELVFSHSKYGWGLHKGNL